MSILGTVAIESPCEIQTSLPRLLGARRGRRSDSNLFWCSTISASCSYVDTDPSVLASGNVRRLVDAIGVGASSQRHVYPVGGGALTIPRYVRDSAPTNQTVFEIDGDLIDVVETQMGLAGPQINLSRFGLLSAMPGSRSIKSPPDDSADIDYDAGSRSVPSSRPKNSSATSRRVLRPNVRRKHSRWWRAATAEAATIARVSDHMSSVRVKHRRRPPR
jgi:hypothetical protein